MTLKPKRFELVRQKVIKDFKNYVSVKNYRKLTYVETVNVSYK